MTAIANIISVETGDAEPKVAPNRISAKATKNKVKIEFSIESETGLIGAWRVRLDPLNRNSGKLLASRGMVCGSGDRCGSVFAWSLLLSGISKETFTLEELYADIGEPDGEYEVKVFGSDFDGWNS